MPENVNNVIQFDESKMLQQQQKQNIATYFKL